MNREPRFYYPTGVTQNSDAAGVIWGIRPRRQRGAPEVVLKPQNRVAHAVVLTPFIEGEGEGRNNANILEFELFLKSCIFNEFVGLAGGNILELLKGSAGPSDG